jgi:hypothetical protein
MHPGVRVSPASLYFQPRSSTDSAGKRILRSIRPGSRSLSNPIGPSSASETLWREGAASLR